MKSQGMKRCAFIFLALSLIGCAHAVPKELRERIDKGVSTEALFKDPEAFKGKTVMLGGVIVGAENLKDGTSIEAVERRLDAQGRPFYEDKSLGRFIAVSEGYLDAAIYGRGRLITVVGEIAGKEERPMGEIKYPYVVIKGASVILHKPMPEPPYPAVRFGIGIFHTID